MADKDCLAGWIISISPGVHIAPHQERGASASKSVCAEVSVHFCSAVINRYGFNSKGVDAVRANLLSYRRGLLQRPVNKPGGLPGLVGVNLGAA